MIRKLEQIDPAIFEQPETVISIGDHAYNDLMPIQQKGGRTVWLNPFPNIERPVCDVEVETLDELAGYLTTLTGIF
jgi:FMN phosphatase YigB (HAD superfamily)